MPKDFQATSARAAAWTALVLTGFCSCVCVARAHAQEPEIFPGTRAKRAQPAARAPATRGAGKASATDERGSRAAQDARPKAFTLLDTLQNVSAEKKEAAPAPARDALDDILDRLGGLRAWYVLGRVRFERTLTGLDASGGVLFEHGFTHESRTGFGPAFDHIKWSEALEFGRRSGRTWARSSGIDRPDLELRAKHEVARWSTLAHFPFSLRDRDRFVVDGRKAVRIHGRKLSRVRVSLRDGHRVHGPEASAVVDGRERWDIFVDTSTGLPILTEHYKPGVGTRRILLGLWRRVGADGLQLPFERTILAEDGESPRLLVRLRIR